MLHITEHKTGLKMSGFISLNTSVFQNPYCMNKCKIPGLICTKCYGLSMENTYRRLHKRLIDNTNELINPLSEDSLSNIVIRLKQENKRFIRFHSIGELFNSDHLNNFYNIAESVPDSIFGLWSKRRDIIRSCKKPDNVSLICSNPVIDKPIKWIPKPFNGVFNVVSYGYAIQHNILPNCTGKCIDCLRCYRPEKMVLTTELLKSDTVKIEKGIYQPICERIR